MLAIMREPSGANLIRHFSMPAAFILLATRVWLTARLVSGYL